MGMLSRGNATFAEGLEFEETFPDATTPQAEPQAPAPVAPRRLTVVRDEVQAEPAIESPEPQTAPAPALSAERFDELVLRIDQALQAALDQRIEQRLATFRTEIDRAFASRTAAPAAPAPERKRELPDPVRDAIRAAASVRDVARVVRDAVNGLNATAAFALAMHHASHDEVVYRYRVAADEELGAALRRDGLDDGPDGAAAHADGWVRGHRTLRSGSRNVEIHTVQCAIRAGEVCVGVLTLQTEQSPLPEPVLTRVAGIAANAAPRLVELRDANALRGT
ncbi:MAG TPA: hypothetical protein VEU77_06435 [Candidatus Acidoferrales bacterium]|nr:hypothetical protein [Candidatus Acidoferrales bacterium]